MDGSPLAGFRKPGPALRTTMVVLGAVGLVNALLWNWIPGGKVVFENLALQIDWIKEGQWWRLYALFTSGFLTLPATSSGISHLFFTIIGLYFLSTDLEARWGKWRFVRFLFASVITGSLLVMLFDLIAPSAATIFHPVGQPLFGASAALAGTAVAWSREHQNSQVRLFFVLPIMGKWLLWITIGFCFLELLYTQPIYEGRLAPFGGVFAGLLLGGSPSVLRRLYLNLKLWVMRRGGGPRVQIQLEDRPKKPRSGGPPLRVVYGGVEDALSKRRPSKDKRDLN
jgi:membrane associated rhomboid family serine protease